MGKYEIQITSKAKKDLRRLDFQIQKRIQKAILKLEKNRTPQQLKSLVGKDVAQFRLRVGDYRILYDAYDEEKIVLILRIGHRKDIYR